MHDTVRANIVAGGDANEVRPTVIRRQKGVVAVALTTAVVAISFAALFFKKAQPTHPLVAAGLRLAIAAMVLSPVTIRSIRTGRLAQPHQRAACLAGLFYGVHFGTWVWSLKLTSVAASVTLVTATPLLLAVTALFLKKDLPDSRHWVAIALALLGLIVIGGGDFGVGSSALVGDGLALVGAAAMAGYLLLVRSCGKDLDVWAFSGIATAVGAVLLLGTAIVTGISLRPASLEAAGFIVLAALIPQLIGHTLLTWSLRHTRPTVVGLSTVGEPVGAALLAWMWLGEGVSTATASGCIVVVAAVALAVRERRDSTIVSP